MPRRTDDSRLFPFPHQKAEEHLHQGQDGCAPEGCSKGANLEAADEARSQLEDEGVNHEQEEAQGQDGERERYQFQE